MVRNVQSFIFSEDFCSKILGKGRRRGGGGEQCFFFFCDKFRFAPEIFGKSGRDFSKVPVTNFKSVFLKFKKSCFFVSGAKKFP